MIPMNAKNLLGPRGLVKTSASMYVVRTYETVTICLSTNSLTKKSAISTCLVDEDKTGFAETATTPIESENRLTARLANMSTRLAEPISAEIPHRYLASRAAMADATNSEWLVDVVMKECDFVFHDIAQPE